MSAELIKSKFSRLWHQLSLHLSHGFLSNFICWLPWAIHVCTVLKWRVINCRDHCICTQHTYTVVSAIYDRYNTCNYIILLNNVLAVWVFFSWNFISIYIYLCVVDNNISYNHLTKQWLYLQNVFTLTWTNARQLTTVQVGRTEHHPSDLIQRMMVHLLSKHPHFFECRIAYGVSQLDKLDNCNLLCARHSSPTFLLS